MPEGCHVPDSQASVTTLAIQERTQSRFKRELTGLGDDVENAVEHMLNVVTDEPDRLGAQDPENGKEDPNSCASSLGLSTGQFRNLPWKVGFLPK
eukprot:2897485-Rhodomonas_salina.2